MNYEVFIHIDPTYRNKVHEMDKIATATLSYLDAAPGDITLVFTGTKTVQKLNKEFMGVDRPTDVLSFPNGEEDIDTARMYYGDIVLSLSVAEAQAKEAGHSLKEELTLLIIHGILHLMGFDHSNQEDRQRMWFIQDEILNHLGCEIESPR
jgi:probable rRNA maturation factor